MQIKKMNEGEFARHFEDCIWHNEQFVLDLNTVGKYALSELLRDHGFKVTLTGEGADEIFAGYSWFTPEFLAEPDQSSPDLVLQKNELLQRQLYKRATEDVRASFDKVGVNLKQPAIDPDVEERLNGLSGHLLLATAATQRGLYLPVWQDKFSESEKLRRISNTWPSLARENIKHRWHTLHSGMYAWAKCQLPNVHLTTLADRCEMAHSIEGRQPFLDHQLAELMGDIPPSLKMRYAPDDNVLMSGNSPWQIKDQGHAGAKIREKWILREAMKPFITHEVYTRRKHPFSAPTKWPKDGPLHRLFTRLLTQGNVEALGFIKYSAVKKSMESAFGNKYDADAWRKCLAVGGLVVLSQKFGVARA